MKCNNCDRKSDFIWLDKEGNCLNCSQLHGFDDREVVFRAMVSDTHGPYSWEEWAELMSILEKIDFGCRFDDSGGCINRDMSDKRACCSSCATTFGYLKSIPPEAVPICLENFKRGNGFWTPTGCTLPWKYRSSTCVSYRCFKVRKDEDKSVWIPLYQCVGLGDRQHLPLIRSLV